MEKADEIANADDAGHELDDEMGSESEEDDGQPAVTFRYEEDEDVAANAGKKQKQERRAKAAN